MTAEEELVLQNKFFQAMRDGLEVGDASDLL
jgi:hypothetical protein